MSNKELAAVKLMNEYGNDKIPFLFIVDFEIKEPVVIKLSEVIPSSILFNINGKKNYNIKTKLNSSILFEKHPISYEKYISVYENILKEINAGNTYLLNLTFPTRIATNLTLEQIFLLSRAEYKLLYKNKFVVFSPESFVKISDGIISSFPMKGTIDASIENAEQVILNDPKEIAEHNTIVDLIRNDLSMVSKNVRVEKFRYVEKIETNSKILLQVSSKICGEVGNDYNRRIGEIIFNLLPAGSISGAPKKKTVDIIKSSEIYSRGFYTGIFGYFDGSTLDSGVMIRFIEQTGEGLIFKSGGGITFMSTPESEFQEMIDKVYVPII
ncbi:MAG: aminodeoxychorismate synthase component I [Ignavibacteriales bacterium]|nr:aminodeoxychorismate synthase component I [Ignavibacteriales bacterium]